MAYKKGQWLKNYSNETLRREMADPRNMEDPNVGRTLRAEYGRRVKSGQYKPKSYPYKGSDAQPRRGLGLLGGGSGVSIWGRR